MKKTLLVMLIACLTSSCSRQLRCRFVAIDQRGNILHRPTAHMHSHWHRGLYACSAMIDALAAGIVTETITGDQAGVEVKGPKAQRLRLKQLMAPAPTDMLGVAEARPRFKVLMEVAE